MSTANTMASAICEEIYAFARFSMTPSNIPPINAPGMDPMTDIYAAREVDTGEVSSRDVMKLLQEDGQDVHYFPSFEEIKDFVKAHVKGHDLLITMGAGNVVEIGEELLAEK